MANLHRPLMAVAAVMLLCALASVAGLVFDGRVINGAPAWAKPFKFSVSIAVYCATMAVLYSRLSAWKRTAWWTGTVIAAALVVEQVAILGQMLRGTTSHFNQSTPFDAFVWNTMAFTIMVLWAATFMIGVLLWRHPIGDRALTWSIRLAMAIGLVGLGLGALMPVPTPEQRQSNAEDFVGAHSVGVVDGGPGLPILGWSTTGGDLRIAHFVGMHALQFLPLFAIGLVLLARRRPRLADEATRMRAVFVAAAAYAGLTGLVLWQALRGEPLIYPTAPTLIAVGALAALTVVMAMVVVAAAPRPASAEKTETPEKVPG
ncbi:hypothetical protein [Salininema proteolyticum]|uniref:Uncharacterized protein n=1 Tax=Salininema proteolyticum TaxID=1607685 RepID=A0ABV8TXG3_9ACTN